MESLSDLHPNREVPSPAPDALPAAKRDLRREAIRRTLAHHAGKKPDASAVAATTLSIWQDVVTRLAPVIGVRGVDVLFRRALHLTHRDFPWLAIAGGDVMESAALLANLKARFAEREPEVATEASYTLLVTFTELLTTLIGESLTARLLATVWVSTLEVSKQETAP